MRDDQTGSESRRPGYVGPWSPPTDEAATPADSGRAGAPSPDGPTFEAPTFDAPPSDAPPSDAPPFGEYGQPDGYGQPGEYGQPDGYGQSGGYGQRAAFGRPGGYAQGGAGQPGGPGQGGGYGQGGYTPGGYGQGGYTPGGYTPGGYGQGGYGPGGYGQGGYGPGGYGPPGGYGHPADYIQQQPPPPPGRARGLLIYVVVAALAAGLGAGVVAAMDHNGLAPASQGAPNPGLSPNSGNNPFGNGPGSSSGTGVSNAKEQAVANAVEPGVVDISSSLRYAGGNAEATGMVISPSGLVLTNNHVIDETTGLTATLVSTGRKFPAKWLGYDKTDDVALLQLQGASGLRTVPLGNSSTVKLGDSVIAIGNAEGVGGSPTVVAGSITQLNQTITASDELGGTETLHGMLQTNAQIVEGDSGGPLVSTGGKVIGMDTAASSGSFGDSNANVGFAIPINRALSIAHQIQSGQGSSTIKIGPTGFIGVLVPSHRASSVSNPAQQQQLEISQQGGGISAPGAGQACLPNDQNSGVPQQIAPVRSGTLVLGALCNTPATSVGITAGDVITQVGGHAVGSPNSLSSILQNYRPGNSVSVTWVDTSGTRHVATLNLLQDPPA